MNNIDLILEYVKKNPLSKVQCIAYPKELRFEYIIDDNSYFVKISEIKRYGKTYIEFLKYMRLSPEERLIKNIIE